MLPKKNQKGLAPKKLCLLLALLLAVFSLCSCSGLPAISAVSGSALVNGNAPAAGTQIALITSGARLNTAFGQSVWVAIGRFSGEFGLNSGFFKAEEDEPGAVRSTLELAVRSGAKLVVTMDTGVTAAIENTLADYPEINFILLDSQRPTALPQNAAAIVFSAGHAGWLAGYAAQAQQSGPLGIVCDNTALCARYAQGFALGAQAAAAAMGLPQRSVSLYQLLLGGGTGDEDIALAINRLIDEGATVLFAPTQRLQALAITAVKNAQKSIIGLDALWEENLVFMPANVSLEPQQPLYALMHAWQQGAFAAGQEISCTLADGNILLMYDALPQPETAQLLQGLSAGIEDESLSQTLDEFFGTASTMPGGDGAAHSGVSSATPMNLAQMDLPQLNVVQISV